MNTRATPKPAAAICEFATHREAAVQYADISTDEFVARKLKYETRLYLTTSGILKFVEKVNPQPRFGEFGDNEPGSDFILVVK